MKLHFQMTFSLSSTSCLLKLAVISYPARPHRIIVKCIVCLLNNYVTDAIDIDWKKAYILVFHCTLDTDQGISLQNFKLYTLYKRET